MQIDLNTNTSAYQAMQNKAQKLRHDCKNINSKLGDDRIIIIRSSFNQDIEAAQEAHAQRFFAEVNYRVPVYTCQGALELPWLAQDIYFKYNPLVILAFGAIIKGASYHFEMVCQQSLAGLMQVSLKHHVPIIQGLLTTYDRAQCEERLELSYMQAMQAYEQAYDLA